MESHMSKSPRIEIKILGIYVSGEGLSGVGAATFIVAALLIVWVL
jgi:hypothetical protein